MGRTGTIDAGREYTMSALGHSRRFREEDARGLLPQLPESRREFASLASVPQALWLY
jgi:hypothetical protein